MSRFRKPCPICGCRAIDRDEPLCHTNDCPLRNPCPATSSCSAHVGSWCKRPSGHRAMTLHKARENLVPRGPATPRDVGITFIDDPNARLF